MNRVILLILGLSIIFLALLLIVSSRGKPVWKNPVLFFKPSPSAPVAPDLPSTPLSIVSVLPENGATNVLPDQQVHIVFSRPLNLNEVYISFGPGVVFKTTLNGNTVTIVPQSPFVAGLTYKLLVKFNKTGQLSNQYQFTVAGTPPVTLPDTQPPGAAKQSEEFNRQNHPDIFLANKTPIKQTSFDLYKGMLKPTPKEHYSFVMVSKGDSAQSDLSTTLMSLGLSQEQLSSLEIATISKDQFDKVTAFKGKLPFYSENVSMSYDKSFDKTTININQQNKTAGEKELTVYLKQNGVESMGWINNLLVVYQ